MPQSLRMLTLCLVILALLAGSALAADPPCPNQGQGMRQGQGQGGHPPGPPPESIEACQGKSENDACSFTSPRGTVEGLCLSPRGQLHCVPKDGPGRGKGPGNGKGPGSQQSE